MLYTVASADWLPGHPLTPTLARDGLFRSRSEVRAIAVGRPILAVALLGLGEAILLAPRWKTVWLGLGILFSLLTVVVVFPTPPFWFATVRIRRCLGLGK